MPIFVKMALSSSAYETNILTISDFGDPSIQTLTNVYVCHVGVVFVFFSEEGRALSEQIVGWSFSFGITLIYVNYIHNSENMPVSASCLGKK